MPIKLLDYMKEYLPVFSKATKGAIEITSENVLQHGNKDLEKLINSIIDKLLMSNSEFRHSENLEKFLNEVNSGKKGIVLAEHYSNFDYPILLNLMCKAGSFGVELAEKCIAIAGLKLGEEETHIASMTECYDRLFIYPSRSIYAIQDEAKRLSEIKRSKQINLASMRALENLKKEGRVVVVFPAGTRYRPGKPETKRGVKEIDSYIKTSDIMLLVSINGNCLRIAESGDMTEDLVCSDRMILDASDVINCTEFRDDVKKKIAGADCVDKKQAVVDHVMDILERMHEINEKDRI